MYAIAYSATDGLVFEVVILIFISTTKTVSDWFFNSQYGLDPRLIAQASFESEFQS
jgi:hypothetical protein